MLCQDNISDNGSEDNVDDKSNVAVLLPSALTESFEIVLARAFDLIKAGERVELIKCEGAISGCVANPFGLKSICIHCRNVRDESLGALKIPVSCSSINYESAGYAENSSSIPEERESDIIAGVDSTILTFYRRHEEGFYQYSPRRFLISLLKENYIKYSRAIYLEVYDLLKRTAITRLELFNGRIVPNFAVLKAAEDAATDFSIIEVSGSERQLVEVRNQSIHDFDYRQNSLREFIELGKYNEAEGIRFFESRRLGRRTDTISFVNQQKYGLIQEAEKPILAIFTSSTDEFEFLGDQWFTEASKSPLRFIQELSELVGDEYRIIVRMHPNQAGDFTGSSKNLKKGLSLLDCVELIEPRAPQSTYELIDKASVVLTFGSSVGVEATYAGKPSILVGKAVWDFLNIAYYAESPRHAAKLLEASISAKSKKDALIVASYYMVGDGNPGSLKWDKKNQLFFVDGYNFLSKKRKSITRYISRIFDKWLRMR